MTEKLNVKGKAEYSENDDSSKNIEIDKGGRLDLSLISGHRSSTNLDAYMPKNLTKSVSPGKTNDISHKNTKNH